MRLITKFTADWKEWIKANIDKGVEKTYIFNVLIENGFSYQSVVKEMNFEPKLKQQLSNEWKEWLNENISSNHNKDGLFKVLLMHGFSFDAIEEEMCYRPSIPLDELINPMQLSDKFTIDSIDASKVKKKQDESLFIPNAIKLNTDKLEIFYIDNFLNQSECEYLIKIICSRLRPSKLTSPDSDKFFRTSKTCDLADLNDKTVENIDNRICRLLQINEDLSEPIQGQYYEVGQEFKPHTDFFESHELKINGRTLGQRSYTVMIYLNSTEEGGETTFPLINEEFSPIKGRALIWHNLHSDSSPNTFSMHHAKQVRKGYKAVITKWFRTGRPVAS